MSAYPKLRVLHKQAARLKGGSPWVYSNEVVMDKAVKALPAGTLVDVIGEQGNEFGTAYFNPHSLIAARLLTARQGSPINEGFFADRIQQARNLRDRLIRTPYYRLLHADADGCPGLIIDRFDDVFVAQSGTAGMDALEKFWLAALVEEFKPRTVFIKSDAPSRAYEGLKDDVRCAHGNDTALAVVEEAGVRHEFNPLTGQKTGWFFDQRDNRAFLLQMTPAATLLDAFSYTGALALGAVKAGAKTALMLDASQAALDQAMETARRNNLSPLIETRKCDAMQELEDMAPTGELFDVVSVDPPPFVRAKKDLESGARGYRKLAKLSAALVARRGFLSVASCSHAISAERFQTECSIGIARSGRQAKLVRANGAAPDHPVHPMLPETAYLKSLVYQLD
ncbi:MAG: class I SAM-dependent rRNA methyltransferase [Micropepsaceae bacterium]